MFLSYSYREFKLNKNLSLLFYVSTVTLIIVIIMTDYSLNLLLRYATFQTIRSDELYGNYKLQLQYIRRFE